MFNSSSQAGNASRAVMLVALFLLAFPLLLITLAVLGWRATAVRADDMRDKALAAERQAMQAAREAQQLAVEAESATNGLRNTANARAANQWQTDPGEMTPVTETEYRTETFETMTPVQNPSTGEVEIQKTVGTRMVPVTRTRFAQTFGATGQDPMVARLIAELRNTSDEDASHDRKLGELRQRLELEFANMHDRQEKEIEQTEARLNALRKLHEQRGQNRDKIVQRRIDELLGRTDDLQWEIAPRQDPRQAGGFYQPTPQGVPIPGFGPPASSSPPDSSRLEKVEAWGKVPPRAFGANEHLQPPRYYPPINPPGFPQQLNDFTRPPMEPPTPVAPQPPRAPQAPAVPPTPPAADFLPPTAPAMPDAVEYEENFFRRDQPSEPRFDDPTSGINRIFDVVRKTSAAELELKSAALELQRVEQLRSEGAIPWLDLQKAKTRHSQLQRETEFNRLELEALRESLNRNRRFAEEQFETVSQSLEVAREKFNSGLVQSEALIRAKQEANQMRMRIQQAEAYLQQLERVTKLLPQAEEAEPQTDVETVQEIEVIEESVEEDE